MITRLFITLAALITIPAALALTDGRIGVEGYVTSFDKDIVTIESGHQKLEIPRKLYSYKVKAGEKIVVEMDQKEFESLKKQELSPAKK